MSQFPCSPTNLGSHTFISIDSDHTIGIIPPPGNHVQQRQHLIKAAEEKLERSAKDLQVFEEQLMSKSIQAASHDMSTDLGNEMVELYIGEEEKLFRVDKTMLCVLSYFDMFNLGFTEGKENTATFPEDDPQTFDIFLIWVYMVKLVSLTKPKLNMGALEYQLQWSPAKLYALADKFCLTQLMDQIMDVRVGEYKMLNLVPDAEMIASCYRDTPLASAPRKYVSRLMCGFLVGRRPLRGRMSPQEIHALMLELPELNLDVLQILAEHNTGSYYGNLLGVPLSLYHVDTGRGFS